MSGNNTYKRLNDHEIEINGVIYTDGGFEPTNGNDPLYPTESTPPTGTGAEGSATPPSYVYVPGSAAPTDGDPLSYAGWLQGSTKYQAEQDRIRKEQQAQTDRQRQIVDANSAYMQGRALYGANAERMASMGLTNSGYGEYLMGKAYATQRGEVQNANRTAQQRIDQAYYEEGILKQQADAKYAEDLIRIQDQQNADYAALYDSALKGASIESIMQDSRWATLTPEQQSVIRGATVSNSIKIRIDNGESLETIMADPASGWNDLTVDQQNTLNTYSTSKTEAKNAEIASNFERFLTAINNGSATLDDIKALPGYQEMVTNNPAYATQLQAAWDKVNQNKTKTEEEEKENLIEDTAVNKSQSEIDAAVSSGTLDAEVGNAAKDAQNKSAYNSVVTALNGGDATTIGNAFADLDKLYSNGYVDKSTYDEAKALLDSTPSGIAYQYSSGKIDVKQFVEKMVSAGYGTSNTVIGGWYVKGLGSGASIDKIKLTVGDTSRNEDAEYSLKVDKIIKDESTIKALNKLATGSENETPSIEFESMFGSSKVNSTDKPGKVVLYNGSLYIYTQVNGWVSLKSSGGADSSNKAIAAWMGGQNYDNVSNEKPTNFSKIQDFINENGMLEGDRARWGQAFKFAGILDIYNSLTEEEKKALKGK